MHNGSSWVVYILLDFVGRNGGVVNEKAAKKEKKKLV